MSVDTQDAKTKEKRVDATPAEGKITDEAVANAKAMVGLILRPEGPYLQDATSDTMRNFCNGIGDLNPLYREEGYGRDTRFGSQIAHPMFPMAYGWLGRTRWGLPGVHGFYVGNDWEIFRHVRPCDRLTAIERIVGVEEKQSEFSGRLVMQLVEGTFINQRDEIVARVLGTCTRHERRSARKKQKYKQREPHDYKPEELEAIDEAVLNEAVNIRGGKIRYWEDVKEGETLTDVVRGPLSMMDTMGFLAGCARGDTHGLVLGAAKKHPGHYFRNKESGGDRKSVV